MTHTRTLMALVLAALLAAAVVGCSGSEAEPATTEPAVEEVRIAALTEQGEIPETVLAASVGSMEAAEGARLMYLTETEGVWWEGSDADIHDMTQAWRAESPDNTFYIVYSERVQEDGTTMQLIGVYSLTPTFDTVTHANAPYEER